MINGRWRYRERTTILSALLFSGGDVTARKVIAFCEANQTRFAATISNASGEILSLTSLDSLYRLGIRFGGTRFWMPSSQISSFEKTALVETIGRDHAAELVEKYAGEAVGDLPNIIREFFRFYTIGFVVFHSRSGKSRHEVARSVGETARSIYRDLEMEGRQRFPLDTAGAEADFIAYWNAIFPEHDTEAGGIK